MVAYRTLVLLYKLLKIYLLFSMPLFFKDLSVFKITEKCSNYYHFLFRMYCVVTRFSLRLFCDQSFGKYIYMANLLSQRIKVGVL